MLEREKQARLDAEAQKLELTAKLRAYEDQHQDQIRKLVELERQAKLMEDEKDEKVRLCPPATARNYSFQPYS